MLTGAGFSDNFGFTHSLCQQCLAQYLVSFVCAAVEQIFTLQIKGGVAAFGQVTAFGQRGRTTGVVFQQIGKLRLEGGIFLRANEGLFQLAQRGHQDLRHIHAAKLTKIGVK